LPRATGYREESVRTGNLFLLLSQLTSTTLTNNLSNVSLQAWPVEFMFNILNPSCYGQYPARPPACNSQERKSFRDVREIHSLWNLNRYLSCNRNLSISRVDLSCNMIYISPKSGYDSLILSNIVTSAFIITNIITRQLSTLVSLFLIPALFLRTNVKSRRNSTTCYVLHLASSGSRGISVSHDLNTAQTPAVANNIASSIKLAQPHRILIICGISLSGVI